MASYLILLFSPMRFLKSHFIRAQSSHMHGVYAIGDEAHGRRAVKPSKLRRPPNPSSQGIVRRGCHPKMFCSMFPLLFCLLHCKILVRAWPLSPDPYQALDLSTSNDDLLSNVSNARQVSLPCIDILQSLHWNHIATSALLVSSTPLRHTVRRKGEFQAPIPCLSST